MSEEILSAILKLLAIVAKEDELTQDEKKSVEHFLHGRLNSEAAQKYYRLFEDFTKDQQYVSNEDLQIKDTCDQINHEQTAQQKTIILLELIALIAADGMVSQRENELLYFISEQIHIERSITDLIKAFVILKDPTKINSKNALVVDNGSLEIPEKCKHISRPTMEGYIHVLSVPGVDLLLVRYVGDRDVTLNETPMRSGQIYTLASGSSIKFTDSDPIYQSEIINQFRTIAEDHHLTFVAQDVTYKFKNGNVGLRNINIQEESGKLIALMGGSGAGKSTLLNVLNGNEEPTEGSVRINGVDIHHNKQKIEGVIGYVPQDDLLIEELTVFDNLYYAARLCFRQHSEEELQTLVTKTLESLGLYETRKLKVGSPLEKTISGGQRKRLNIGLELLREPSVLFVDEPTSGLSSRDSENIMDLLKELSLKGKMVFVVIHQPSEDIFRLFDKLVILDVGGYQVYYGNPIDGINYFKDIVKMVDRTKGANPEQIFNIIETKVVNEYGNFTKERKVSPYQWYKYFQENIKIPKVEETNIIPHKTLHIPNKLKQLGIFTIRDFKSKLSNKQYLTINLLEAPVLAILLAFIVRYLPEDVTTYSFSENLNIPVFFFMSVIVSLFMGLTVSAEEIIKDRKILKRESFLNLSRLSYLFSKLIILFGISAFQTMTYILIGSWLLGVKGMFLPFWLVLFSVSCFSNVLGLNISSGFKSAVTVYILIPLMVIPQLILSGVVVNFDKLNPLITSENKVPMIGEIMASRWAFEALSVTQFKDNPYESLFYEDDKTLAQSEFKTAYLIPRLKEDLNQINEKLPNADEEQKQELAYKLRTIYKELGKELSVLGEDKLPQYQQLESLDQWSESLYEETSLFLDKLNAYYNVLYNSANESRQSTLAEMNATPEQHHAFMQMKKDYTNKALSVIVKNLTTEHRIVEHKNEYVQKIYPIYQDPEFPDHALDFRAQFYQPTKHIVGIWIDTLVFNVMIIWSMTIVLFIILYFDGLRRFLSILSR